jgi:spermidine/putrescine transport system ATP-binding protein
MKEIRLIGIKKSYNGEQILHNFNLTIPSGQFFALLGPSGCGKTTVLRLIAGFETVDEGSIFLGQEDITYQPINQRRVNTVFQHYALFPHLNVFDNIAYSQRIRGIPEDVIESKVIKMLRMVDLDTHIYKPIDQLSGGQRQRVTLARSIINEPDVLLLDESLTALDPKLREKMLLELIDLQTKLKTTFVYVTHDHFEALTVADQMAIMNQDGYIEQIGTPKEIYEFPASSFVATFVGITNLLSGTLHGLAGNKADVAIDQLGVISVYSADKKDWMIVGKEVLVSVRPEKILISKKEVEGFANRLQGTVESIVYHGRSTQYNILLTNKVIISVFEQNEEHFPKETIDYDDVVNLYWQKENAVLLER